MTWPENLTKAAVDDFMDRGYVGFESARYDRFYINRKLWKRPNKEWPRYIQTSIDEVRRGYSPVHVRGKHPYGIEYYTNTMLGDASVYFGARFAERFHAFSSKRMSTAAKRASRYRYDRLRVEYDEWRQGSGSS